MKDKGNAALASGEYSLAVKLYTEAISHDSKNHVLYSNRSAAHAKAGNYDASLEDAETTVSLNPTWSKGYSRKGSALAYLGRYEEAIAAYEEGLKLEPNNEQLASGLAEVKKQSKIQEERIIQKLSQNPKTREWLKDPDYIQLAKVS